LSPSPWQGMSAGDRTFTQRGIDATAQVAGSRATGTTVTDSEVAKPLLRPPAVTRSPPSPLLGRAAGLRRKASVSSLSRLQRATHLALGVLWVMINFQFWSWWIPRAQGGEPWLAITVSAALAYQASLLPTMFWWFLAQMRRPLHRRPPRGLRVAMITLCVPSFESLDVIEGQLRALRAVRYPHDSWILDEEDSLAVRELAARYGIRYFTRAGIDRWNQPQPPHQRKTKAGNVNAWLAHLIENNIHYHVFVQLDVDHRPDRAYLDRVLGHFDDVRVAWVQAPSVCGNLGSWPARGLAEQDLVFQGPLQMGFYGSSGTPFIVGSHTAYRTSAILEIGGFQPTRAEDHLDTVVLAAHGYRGVYVPEIIARGDGPEDFRTYMRQQYAWAHSMITVLFWWTPRLLRRYSLRQGVQFLFSQTWYPLWSLSTLALWAGPLAALLSDRRIAATTLWEYLLYFVPVALTGWLMWCFARPWFKPQALGISWRGVVLTVARWPVVLWAFVSVLMRIKRPYMITPKGACAARSRPAAVTHGPLLGLATVALCGIWLSEALGHAGESRAYVLLVLINALITVAASATILVLEMRDAPVAAGSPTAALRTRIGAFGWLLSLVGGLAATTVLFWDSVQAAVS
jgi:cellulose synthase (UDP-forming)